MIDHRKHQAAEPCPICNGRGSSLGVFHRLRCEYCAGVGFLQVSTGQPVDLRAAKLLAPPTQPARSRETTYDTWILKGNFRGD